MADIQRRWEYNISRGGVFIGKLRDEVITPFGYSQTNNSGSVQVAITVQLSVDTSRSDSDFLMTESGDFLMTESGDFIMTERQPDLVGNSNSKSLIRNNNQVVVYEFSNTYPSGKVVFTGNITQYEIDSNTGTVNVTMLNTGADLDDYVIESAQLVDQSNASWAAIDSVFYQTVPTWQWNYLGQSWVVGAGATNLSAILLKLASDNSGIGRNATVTVYDNSNFSGVALGSATRSITGSAAAEWTFTFATPISVVVGATYYFAITSTEPLATGPSVFYQDSAGTYASGDKWSSSYAGGSGGGTWSNFPGQDLYFKTYYTSSATQTTFSSTDPGTIVSTIITNYNSQGGAVSAGTINTTGTTVTYTFQVATILEGIKKMADLSPSTWYWYVDPATNLLYFKQTSTTATHTFIKGRHLNSVKIKATIENVKNVVYLSGGDTGGGVNLFVKQTSLTSIASYGRGLARVSDNRITLSATASAATQNIIDGQSTEQYQSNIEIMDSTYDMTIINPGDTVAFSGFGNFIDSLLLQVAGKQPGFRSIQLALGELPKRPSQSIDEALRALNDLQTIKNPSTAS